MSFNRTPFSAPEDGQNSTGGGVITLFMCGDVMTGRGIDQILALPGDPLLHESYMKDARAYVEIAEKANGPIPRSVDAAYIWGDALGEMERVKPDLRIINLETSITKSPDYWEGKGVHYRMNPENIGCLSAARIDICSLANNHVIDWGYAGFNETLETLQKAGIRSSGAGRDLAEARSPAIFELTGGRVILFSFGSPTSGIPSSWAASKKRPGINLLNNFSDDMVLHLGEEVQKVKVQGDISILSIHWGGNWGFHIPSEQIEFAHSLIDRAGIDIIHGHSSHHVKAIEVYRDKLILYGCGDFLNDYEGIGGFDYYRSDLGLMYFAKMDPFSGRLAELELTPTQIRHFRVNRASSEDVLWLAALLNREGERFGTGVKVDKDNILKLMWG